jgi:hypothetical protein
VARVKGPLLSLAATGIFGPMEYRTTGLTATVHPRRHPATRTTAAQTATRIWFAGAVANWRTQPQATRDAWIAAYAGQPTNGYQAWIQQSHLQNVVPPDVPSIP